MAIKIEMLRCFYTVAQTGSLAQAALRLGRSSSALSMTLKQLEDHLGQRLFESDRKNRLTTLGAQVYDLAQRQLLLFDETVAAIETSARAPTGLIRVVSVPSVASVMVPPALEEMRQRHPDLMIELRDTDTRQVIDALVQGQADIGIASGLVTLNGIRSVPLFQDQFGLVCAPDHLLARQDAPLTIQQVTGRAFIRNALCDMIETPAFQQEVSGAGVAVHNTLSLIAMLRRGHWVTVLPQSVVRIASGDLVFRPLADLPDRRQVVLYVREHPQFRELIEEFVGLIVERSLKQALTPIEI